MAEIDGIELDEFNNMVDNMIEDIEAGRTKANPLASEDTVADADLSGITVKETATEMGENSVTETLEPSPVEEESEITKVDFEQIVIGDNKFDSDGETIGKAGKVLIVVSNTQGEVVFGSAAVAAREAGLNPTTVRNRCSKEYVDSDGNTWVYRDKPTEEA